MTRSRLRHPSRPLALGGSGLLAVGLLAAGLSGLGSTAQHPTAAPRATRVHCPTGQHLERDVSLAGFAAGRTAACASPHPETYAELAAANGQAASRALAPLGSVRDGASASAYAEQRALAAAGSATGAAWQPLGTTPLIGNDPSVGSVNGEGFVNLSGRIEDFAYDAVPGHWYAAVANGGVHETTDAGGHWRSVGDSLPTQTTGTVAKLPDARLLVGTGDPAFGGDSLAGVGAYYTDDDGAHWTKAAGVPDGALSFQFADDPTTPGTVYLATSKGLYRSTDSGTSYSRSTVPSTCESLADPNCFFANIVTDVVVQAGSHKVLAALGWRAGQKPNAAGKPQAPQNGLYESDNGVTFTYQRPAGFPSTASVGRTALGIASGAGQDQRYVYALVEDAPSFNGGAAGLDIEPGTGGAGNNTVLNGLYGSSDFGASWTQLASAKDLQSPTTQSALSGGAQAATYSPGIQGWYNEWVQPDPTLTDPVTHAPTHLAFGLEEVWQNTTSNNTLSPITIVPGGVAATTNPNTHGTTTFQVVGRYFGGNSCYGLNGSLPGPCTQNLQNQGTTSTHPDQHAGSFVPDADGSGVTLLVGNDGGAYAQHTRSPNVATQAGWGDGTQGTGTGILHTLLPYDAEMAKDGTLYAGLQDNGEMKMTPDGKQIEVYGGDGFYTAVDPDNSSNAYEEYVGGDISVTTDGGSQFSDITPCLTSPLFATPFVMDPQNAKHLIVGGREVVETLAGTATLPRDEGTGLCTNPMDAPDATQGWVTTFNLGTAQHPGDATVASSGSDPNNQLSAVDLRGAASYVGFCGFCDVVTQGLPFHSGIATNVGGAAPPQPGTASGWHVARALGLPQRYVTDVAVDPADPRTVFVTLGGYGRRWIPPGALNDDVSKVGVGHVFVSHDAGDTFSDVSGNLPDAPADSVLRHGDQLLVGTDTGVFTTNAAVPGAYASYADGLPAVPVMRLRTAPRNPDEVIAATFGRGVYNVVGRVAAPAPDGTTGGAGASGAPPVSGAPPIVGLSGLGLAVSSRSVRYGNALALRGRMMVRGTPAVGVPVHLTGRTNDKKVVDLGTVRTDVAGYYTKVFKPRYDATYTASGGGLTSSSARSLTTLTFLHFRGVARHGMLDIRGSATPGYALSPRRHEQITVWLADGKGHKLRVLGRTLARSRHGSGGAPLQVNDFHLSLRLPAGKSYTIVVSAGAQPLNAGADGARFTVRA